MNEMNDNKALKRSSLKMSSHFTQQDILAIQQKNKRNSVNWASSIGGMNTNFKEIKTSFGIIEEENGSENKGKLKGELNKKFDSARRESIKNEFTLAKKYLKENNIESLETEEEDIEETKKNTIKNLEVGKTDACDIDSEDSKSKSSEGDEKEV